METTLIILKPDAVQRSLMGTIIARFEQKGLRIVGAKMMQITDELASKHYAEHADKPFYNDLKSFMTSNPVLALAVAGDNAIAVCRTLMGKTNAIEADPGTIRGDFGLSKSFNLVHGSDSPESAQRELELFFNKNELFDYNHTLARWITE